MCQLTFKLLWHLEIENELFLSGSQGKIRKTKSWHHYSLAFCIYMFKGCVSMSSRKHHAGACFFTVYSTSSVQYSIQPSVHSLSSRVCIPGYSWMYSLVYSQCMVYIPVCSVQSSVHSLSSIVYTPAYSPVYKCTSMHSPLYSVHSSVQLRHS